MIVTDQKVLRQVSKKFTGTKEELANLFQWLEK